MVHPRREAHREQRVVAAMFAAVERHGVTQWIAVTQQEHGERLLEPAMLADHFAPFDGLPRQALSAGLSWCGTGTPWIAREGRVREAADGVIQGV